MKRAFVTYALAVSMISASTFCFSEASAQSSYTMVEVKPTNGPDLWIYDDDLVRCVISKTNMECVKK